MNLLKQLALLLTLTLLAFATPYFTMAEEDEDEDAVYEEQLKLGKKYYDINCRMCHGPEGDAKSFIDVIRYSEKNGRLIETFPRDFTFGVYKFRSTSTGCLPSENDLMQTIKNGISRSFMPPKENITDEELKNVTQYVIAFSERFEEEDPCDVITTDKPGYVGSKVSIDKGKQVYKKMKCGECHGDDGRGNGTKANEIVDDKGRKVVPFNFISGDLKRGSSAENVYMTFTSGLDGSGMPSYEDSLTEEDRWNMVSYTLKLMGLTGNQRKSH